MKIATSPVTPKGQAARRRIVEIAARLMQDQGVRNTTLDNVQEAASAGRSQLYHYFSGKRDLVRAVIDFQAEGILAPTKNAHSLSTWEGWEQWRSTIVRHYAQMGCRGGCPLGSLASELADTDEEARQRVSENFKRWEQTFRVGLQIMRDKGTLSCTSDPAHLAVVLLTAFEGGLLMSQTHRDVSYLEISLGSALAVLRSHATDG